MLNRPGHLLRVYWLETLMVLPLILYIGLLTLVELVARYGFARLLHPFENMVPPNLPVLRRLDLMLDVLRIEIIVEPVVVCVLRGFRLNRSGQLQRQILKAQYYQWNLTQS